MRPTHSIIIGLSAIFLSYQLSAQPGTLDPSFNGIGYNVFSLTPGLDEATDVLALADGSSLICGRTQAVTTGDVLLFVAHINSDGSLDTTFSTQGYFTYGGEGYGYSLALTSDGGILVCGDLLNDWTNTYYVLLIKLTMSGQVDPTFGTNGVVKTNVGGGYFPEARGLVVQNDGKIVVCGKFPQGGTSALPMIIRYLPDGSLDPGFGTYIGMTVLDNQGNGVELKDVAVLQDGSVVAAGYFILYNGGYRTTLIIKLDSTGIPDESFAPGGELLPDLSSQDDAGAVLSNGTSCFIAGQYYEVGDGSHGIYLIKMNADGSFVDDFGENGQVRVPGVGDPSDLAIMDSGEILVAGSSCLVDDDYCSSWLIYFTPDGQLDTDVNTSGAAQGINAFSTTGNAIAIQPDGKVLLTGEKIDSDLSAFVARYKAGPTLGVHDHVPEPNSLQIYPVPTDGQTWGLHANSDMPGPMTLTLLDANGRMVGSPMQVFIKAGQNPLPAEMLRKTSPGVYHLRILSGTYTSDQPFVLIR